MFYPFYPTGGRFFLTVAFCVFFLSIISAYTADVRCELVADSCLDLSRVTNQTITVPSNTTRIDKNGFDLCLPSNSINTDVDLVFVVDQSTSMDGSDPDFLTPPATIAALNLIDKISPSSNVGYLAFAAGVCDGTQKTSKVGKGQRLKDQADTRVLPKPLNTPGHKDMLLNQMAYDETSYLYGCGSNANRGTNYYLAIFQAQKWLDQMDSPNKKIIIFLTDGRPSKDIDKFNNLVDSEDSTTFPLVHAMFVGSQSNADLERLTLKTGGIFTQMDDFSKLESVMLDMIGTSLISNAPDKTVIKKNGVIVFETANHTSKGGARHQVNLSHDLALELGTHSFNVSATTSWAGVKADNFNLIVGGPAETTTGVKDLPGTDLFSAVCYDVSSISATEKGKYSNTITQLGAFYETGFGISLKTPADDIDGVARVLGSGDEESVTLDSSASGYHGPVVFAGTVLKTPKNGTVEAVVGETLLLSWEHPYDPRDTASALLAIVDDRADSTSILFTDMQGNIITSTGHLAGNQFKVVVFDNKATGPFSVQLTSSHGDALTVTVINTGPQTFESAVTFGFSNTVNPANLIIEGLLDPTSTLNQTTVTAKVKKAVKTLLLQKKYIPVEKSWIVDQDGDGRADKVFIRYSGKLSGPPATVADIHWPDNITIAKNASAIENPISFFNGDSSLVQIDLSGNPFDFGATSASSESPPTLLLPDGVKLTIQDSVKPILIGVDKRPSDFSLYMRARDSVFVTRPDTLIITLSEAINPDPNAVAPWNTLLLVEKNGVLQPVEFIKEPEVVSLDGRIIKALIRNQLDSNNLNADNTVTLNPEAQYVDGKNNTPAELKTRITGRDSKKNNFISTWRGGPVSGDKGQTSFSESLEVVVIDESLDMIVGVVTTINVEQWVPPVGIDPGSGNVIDINYQMGGLCTDNQKQKIDFPDACLSSRLILTGPTDGPYIAHINIYDHLGKFIRNFKQAYGYCGELDNPVRTTESGFKMNDLVWNLKDVNGDRVGTGVYIWRVKLHFQSKKTKSEQFRMGVFRKNDGLYNACIQGL